MVDAVSISSTSNSASTGFIDAWPIQPKTSVFKGGEFQLDTIYGTTHYPVYRYIRPRTYLNGYECWLAGKSRLMTTTHYVHENNEETLFKIGFEFRDFKRDWYDRIHITPRLINLGNLLSDVTRAFEVWSAYLQPKNLDAIVEVGTQGLTLVRPVAEPVTFKALESKTYNVSVATVGPSAISASYSFDFEGEVVPLTVLGSRVTVFPYEPDWSNGIMERIEWLTDVITNYNGSENRAKLRHIPRKIYEFDVVTHKSDQRQLDSLLMNWQFRAFALPVWSDGARIPNDFPSGQMTFNIDTTNRDYVVGGSVIFVVGVRYESAEIASFTSTSITLELPMANSWARGSMAYPVRICRLPQDTAGAFVTTQTGRMTVRFQADENDPLVPTELGTTYRSLPILIDQPNYDGNITTMRHSKISEIDNLISKPVYEVETANVTTTTDYIWIKKTKAEIYTLKKWLHARYGRWKTVWVPSWNIDMVVHDNALTGSTTFRIKNIGYDTHLKGKINRRDIMIRYKDDTYDVRRIVGSEANGVYESIQISESSSQEISPDNVKMVSYVELKRLTSDALELAWITPNVVRLDHKFVSVYDDV